MLASLGGTPVRKKFLPYGRQHLDDTDIETVSNILRGDWLTTGPTVEKFESSFAAWNNVEYAIAVSSGTAALHAASFAAGFTSGDEVITSPLTFAATANCILYQGASPVFADVDPNTLCISPKEIEKKITSKTKGIIVMHYAGQPCEMDQVMSLAEEYKLVVIEDACHAMGSTYKGKQAGTIGHLACYSFHPVKHITTGEGGMVVTSNDEWAKRIRGFRNHGMSTNSRQRNKAGEWVSDMSDLGYNYRLSDFQSALGFRQLSKVNDSIKRRREIAQSYDKSFKKSNILEPITVMPENNPSWHIYPILLNLNTLSVGRKEIYKDMRAENIGVNVHYRPVHMHSYYKHRFGYLPGDFPNAENAYDRLLTLPIFPQMTDQDVQDVIKAIEKVSSHYIHKYRDI